MAEKSKRYAYQLEIKGQEISELSRAVEELKNQTCSCDAQSEDSISLANKYDELMAKYQEAANKLKMYEETNSQRFREIQLLKKKEKDLVAQMAKLQKNLTTTSNNNNLTIAELNSSKQEKCSIIQCQKNELACKVCLFDYSFEINVEFLKQNKQIEILLKNEEKLKKRIVQLQEELVSIKITDTNRNDQAVVLTAQDCSIHLTDELQDLITALYEEIDKALAKDEHIQQQNRNICCLQCALSSKEKELTCVRNELKILKEQFTSTLKEKQTLTDQLQASNVEVQNATYEEERFSRKCYCEI
ncbi:leucine-rich repeat-containing protein [Asbolus verrucosus]|uniref:Leucine-rich repeat-containing protein n=1 Tax=Asbolus verrucosus TaxID=1661398 RepID=A0A482VEA9_ASBVE|nr:leucine-rich repeat-containing protein [Asbolus verrucosus]